MLAGTSTSLPDDAALRASYHNKALLNTLVTTSELGPAAVDEQGRNPLHVAVWQNAPLDVIRRLLSAHPEWAQSTATNSEWLPLHIALQAKAPASVSQEILQAHRGAAAIAGAHGQLPLHVAARKGASAATVEALLEAYPAGLSALSQSGDTPGMTARKSGQHEAARVIEMAEHREAERRAEEVRAAERQHWESVEQRQRDELQRVVQVRVDEHAMAQQLVDASASAQRPDGMSNDAVLEAARLTSQKLKEEEGAREKLEQQLFEERSERERLQAALDEAQKGKKKKKKDKSPPKSAPEDMGNPADWNKHTSKSGKPYWYNKATKKSVWKDPTSGR